MKPLSSTLKIQAKLLREQGLSYPQIANTLGISNTVYKWLNPTKAKQYYLNYYPRHRIKQKQWTRKKAGKQNIPLDVHANTKLFFPKFDFDLGYVLGVLYGDGCVYNENVALSTIKDHKIAEAFAYSLGKAFNRNPFNIMNLTSGYFRVSTHRKHFAEWFNGITLKSLEKLLERNPNMARGFVGGFYDSEGWVSKRRSKQRYTYQYIRMCNKNGKLLKIIQKVLEGVFLIYSSVWNTRIFSQYAPPNGCKLWYVEIQSQTSVERFMTEIKAVKNANFEVEWRAN